MIRNNVKSIPYDKNPNLMVSYGIHGKKIRPIRDELGKPFDVNALYDKAFDISITMPNGEKIPRFEYVESDIDVEIIEEQTNEEISAVEE